MEEQKKLYHYTNHVDVALILESKVLKTSDLSNGTGVFLTKCGPSAGKETVFKNIHADKEPVPYEIHPRKKDVDAVLVFDETHIPGKSSV